MLFGVRRKIRASISLRIAFLFCATFAVGLAIAFLVTYFELRYSLEKSSKEILVSKLQEAKTLVSTEGVAGLSSFLLNEKNRIINAPFLVRVATADGKTLYVKPSIQQKSFDFEKIFKPNIDLKNFVGFHSIEAIDDEDIFNILTEPIDGNIFIQVGRSSEEREGILEAILLNFAMVELILVFISAFLGIWYARKSLAPLRDILKTIRSIEQGNLSQRIQIAGSEDELRDIVDTFNRMISRIEKLILAMHESLDNVAHDIRTPLTRIRAVAEDALLSKRPPQLQVALEDCAEGAAMIGDLVEQLLSLSEAEAGELKLKIEFGSIKNVLTEVVEVYDFVAQEKLIRTSIECEPEELVWPIDHKRLKQAIANLLDNAIKFSEENSAIKLRAVIENDELMITVIDQGSGVSSDDLPKIWDRLYRGDKSRGTKGLGLGLSIVRSVVLAHSGRCQAENNINRGMRFSIILPKHLSH